MRCRIRSSERCSDLSLQGHTVHTWLGLNWKPGMSRSKSVPSEVPKNNRQEEKLTGPWSYQLLASETLQKGKQRVRARPRGSDGRSAAECALGAEFVPCAADGGDSVSGAGGPYQPPVFSPRYELDPHGGREHPGYSSVALALSHCRAAVITIHLHNFLSCKTETLSQLNNNSPFLPPPAPTLCFLSVT